MVMDGTGERRAERSRPWWSVRLSDFKLTCDNLSDVCHCQDGMPFFVFFLYRFVVAGYFFGFLLYFIVISTRGVFGAKFLIYLTDWTYMEVTLYLCVAFVNVLKDYISDHRESNTQHRTSRRFRYQLQWLLFNISITVSIIVTLVYWPILRPMITAEEKPPLHIDMSIHLFPTIFCLLDLIITKMRVKYHHVLYPALYLVVYGLFAIIYWAAGGTDPYGHPYIYPIIDFENEPGIATATVFGMIIAVLLSHAFVKLLYYLRVRFVDRRSVADTYGKRESLIARQDHTGEVI